MRILTVLVSAALMLMGCRKEETGTKERTPIALEELSITVNGTPRSYMQSDRAGAFLIGTVGGDQDGEHWSVDGSELLSHISLETANGTLTADRLDSARILPYETRKFYHGGISVALSVLEGLDSAEMHALFVHVEGAPRGTITLRPTTAAGVVPDRSASAAGMRLWTAKNGSLLILTAGSAAAANGDGVSLSESSSANFLLLSAPRGTGADAWTTIHTGAEAHLASRKARMEHLLNASYIRTSDDTLNKALQWIKLSLDALIVGRRDTFAVAGLPWDGSIDGRDNAQAIAGLGLATGDYRRTSAVIRTLARYQDTLARSATYGRLPDHVLRGRATYGGADVASWFVRELYEHVVYADDTLLVRALYPVIRRSIDGTLKTHTDTYNLLVHGGKETWMSAIERGNRAAEIQVSWYFQQLIGRFVASYVGDTTALRRWENLPEKTAQNFITLFADTASKSIADHLNADGTRDTTIRPNAIMCLELLDGDGTRFKVTRTAVKELMRGEGIATLAPSDARFVRSGGGSTAAQYNGTAWTWLAGPLTYALTRFDRQDVAFGLTKEMAHLVLATDMAGTLPAMRDPAPAGPRASLTGMAEFIRSMYQDYLGVRIDLPSGMLTLQPKFPDQLTGVDFTVTAGVSPVAIEYRRTKAGDRIHLDAPTLPRPLKVNFLWMLESGNAWRGSFRFSGGTPVTIVMGEDDASLYLGDEKGAFDGRRKLKGLSQRKVAADLTPASTATR